MARARPMARARCAAAAAAAAAGQSAGPVGRTRRQRRPGMLHRLSSTLGPRGWNGSGSLGVRARERDSAARERARRRPVQRGAGSSVPTRGIRVPPTGPYARHIPPRPIVAERAIRVAGWHDRRHDPRPTGKPGLNGDSDPRECSPARAAGHLSPVDPGPRADPARGPRAGTGPTGRVGPGPGVTRGVSDRDLRSLAVSSIVSSTIGTTKMACRIPVDRDTAASPGRTRVAIERQLRRNLKEVRPRRRNLKRA